MCIITGARSERASCLQYTPRMYACACLSGVTQQGEARRFPTVTWSLLKLDKSDEIYDKEPAAAYETCAWLQTCPSPKQSCWLPPHPHPGTSTIIFTAGNSKVVSSFRGCYLRSEITCDNISDIANCPGSHRNNRSSCRWLKTEVRPRQVELTLRSAHGWRHSDWQWRIL